MSRRPASPAHGRSCRPFPTSRLDPMAILTQAADKYPNDPQAPQIRLIIAQWTERAGDLCRRAETVPRSCSPAIPAANGRRTRGRRRTPFSGPPSASMRPARSPPDKPGSVSVNCRNLKTVTLRAYKVPLEKVLTVPAKLENPDNRFTQFDRTSAALSEARKLGPQVAEWTYASGDKGDYQYHGETLTTPLTQPGAYLVEASGDDGAGARGDARPDHRPGRDEEDRQRQRPVLCRRRPLRPPDARMPMSSSGRSIGTATKPHVQVGRGVTDADGMVTVPDRQKPAERPDGSVRLCARQTATR